MRLALYQPDIPQNAGTMMRMAACLGLGMDLIEPAGFDATDRALRRAGLDYLEHLDLRRHADWQAFLASLGTSPQSTIGAMPGAMRDASEPQARRIVLLTTKATLSYLDFAFAPGDILLVGRESAGVPDAVHERADARIVIPMRSGVRSLNVAVAAAMVAGEALRQMRLRTP